jgi:very-short-patch-repair endonuclease
MTKPRRRNIPVPPPLLAHSRALRRDFTDAERKLWWLLRNREFAGAKFRRQYPIAGFIDDFCCFESQLVFELDGGQHAERREADQQRTKLLEREGYRIFRFWNEQVLKEPDEVMEQIFALLQKKPN